MAYQQMYVQSGASNLNSGSTTAAAAPYGIGNSDWGNAAANRFTASSGTPFNGAQIGDWASVHLDGATVAVYVAQITAVNASGASIDLSTTAKYGTAPTTGATGRSCKVGGAWADLYPLASLGATTIPSSTKVNVKQATYTLTGALSVALDGTTARPLWISGYNTTPGDLDWGSTSLSYPTVSCGTNLVTFSGDYPKISGLAFTSTRSGAIIDATAGPTRFVHCRFTNTSSNSAATCLTNNASAATTFVACYFSVPATGTSMVTVTTGALTCVACYFDGPGTGTTLNGISTAIVGVSAIGCTFKGMGLRGINVTAGSGSLVVAGCTFSSCLSDSIRLATLPAATGFNVIVNNVFSASGGYDVNNSSGANTMHVYLANNLTYNATSGHLNGFGDWAEDNPLSDGSSPFVSSSDLHLLAASAGAGAGLPGQWEGGVTGIGYADVGAWQRAVSSGGALLRPVALNGGFA